MQTAQKEPREKVLEQDVKESHLAYEMLLSLRHKLDELLAEYEGKIS